MEILLLAVFVLGFAVSIPYSSIFEWTLHKYVMHKPVKFIFKICGHVFKFIFDYPFKAHALVHHFVFRADQTYHLINEPDKKTIPMKWWNGPALITIGAIPFIAVSFYAGIWTLGVGILTLGMAFCLGTLFGMGAYYGTYEYIHWCMHLPRKRMVERSGIFFRLNGHHLLHHRYMGKNFNVVLPLADLCLGTLLLRSKIHFKQALGPSVPNVQPLGPMIPNVQMK
jgi:hypothetical protein